MTGKRSLEERVVTAAEDALARHKSVTLVDVTLGITERQRERLEKPPGIVVIIPVKDWQCAECHETGDFLIMDEAGPLCLTCADMDHLEFLPSGDAALTRRARKASGLSAVVVRWSRTRKRYERQGILVEPSAIEQAEESCLADAAVRERRRERGRLHRAAEDTEFQGRFASEIVRLFPGCPTERAVAIAQHAGLRGSGRVGRQHRTGPRTSPRKRIVNPCTSRFFGNARLNHLILLAGECAESPECQPTLTRAPTIAFVIPSPDEVEAARTTKGGWTRAQLAVWGVPWPPPKGWKERLRMEWEAAADDPTAVNIDRTTADPESDALW